MVLCGPATPALALLVDHAGIASTRRATAWASRSSRDLGPEPSRICSLDRWYMPVLTQFFCAFLAEEAKLGSTWEAR